MRPFSSSLKIFEEKLEQMTSTKPFKVKFYDNLETKLSHFQTLTQPFLYSDEGKL